MLPKVKPHNILLVEDDPGDVDLLKEVLNENRTLAEVKVNVATDGVEAIAYLRRRDEYAGAQRPDLILLDLNLPKKDGRELLREIKSDEDLKEIPVVVLSISRADRDIHQSYAAGVNSYISKPTGFGEFTTLLRSVMNYWFEVVHLPSR